MITKTYPEYTLTWKEESQTIWNIIYLMEKEEFPAFKHQRFLSLWISSQAIIEKLHKSLSGYIFQEITIDNKGVVQPIHAYCFVYKEQTICTEQATDPVKYSGDHKCAYFY